MIEHLFDYVNRPGSRNNLSRIGVRRPWEQTTDRFVALPPS